MRKAKKSGTSITGAQVGAALIVVATLFTIGRSLMVAQATMRHVPQQAPPRTKVEAVSPEAPNSLGLSELHALDAALAARDPMSRGRGHGAEGSGVEFERLPLAVGELPPPASPDMRDGMMPATGVQYSAEPSLVSALGDFAIVRARDGVDHAVRQGDIVDGYVVRAIRADGVVLAAGAKEITLRSRAGN